MDIIEIIKVIILGIVEGITEWLPISSTGHMILLNEVIQLNVSEEFMELFLVVIQLGAIFAVIVYFFRKIWPFGIEKEIENDTENGKKKKFIIKKDTMIMWGKVAIACVPAAIIGILFDDKIDELFYNPWVVGATLIIYGIIFIVVEILNKGKEPHTNDIGALTYRMAIIIGIAQLLALIPGTSRSGVTIITALLLGCSRTLSAEFTFFLSIPVMVGASLVKLVKFGFAFTAAELGYLIIGMLIAFVVSILVIRFLMGFIKKYDFKVFGWYRIVLGLIVILVFLLI